MSSRGLPRAGAHPAFAPFARWLARAPADVVPAHAMLNAWARESALALPDGRPLAFTPPPRRLSALDYERRIARDAEIVTRAGNLHDACNALAWLVFPRTKAALNALHVAAAGAAAANEGGARGSARDAATLLDESGMLVASKDPAFMDAWRAHAWRDAFGDGRGHGAACVCAAAIGHGLIAKCVAPFRALTARALVVGVDAAALPADPGDFAAALDRAAAARLSALGLGLSPAHLLPLPIAALPGWDTEGLGARLFDDASVFRPRPVRHSGDGSGRANLAPQKRSL